MVPLLRPSMALLAGLCCSLLAADCVAVTTASKVAPDSLPAACHGLTYTRLVQIGSASQLKAALTAAVPGDLIVLADGTYLGGGGVGDFMVTVSGTSSEGIAMCASPNAILTTTDRTGYEGLVLQNVRYWTLAGFTVTNALHAVIAYQSSYNHLRGITAHGIGLDAIEFLRFSTHNTIEGNRIYDTGNNNPTFGEGIYIGTPYTKWVASTPDRSDSNIVMGNVIGPDVRAEHVDIKEGSTGGAILNNSFDGTGMIMSQSWGPNSWVAVAGNNWTVTGNRGAHAIQYGFRVVNQLPGWGNDNTFASDTADVGNATTGYGFDIQPATTGNRVLCNNVVLNAAGFANVPCQ